MSDHEIQGQRRAQEAQDREAERPQSGAGRRWITGLLGLLVVLAVAAAAVRTGAIPSEFLARVAGEPAVPAPDTARLDAESRSLVEEAREGVLRQETSPTAWFYYGMVLDANGLNAAAAQAYKRASELDPDDALYPYFHAVMMDAIDAPTDEVVALYRLADERGIPYPPLYVRLGDEFYSAGRYEEAIEAYEQALLIDPEYPIAHRHLGRVLLELGRTDEAAGHLSAAVTLEPEDRLSYELLAQALEAQGQSAQAATAREQAAAGRDAMVLRDELRKQVYVLGPEARKAERLAATYMLEGNYPAAARQLEILDLITPNDPEILERLADAYELSGDPDRAEEVRAESAVITADREAAEAMAAGDYATAIDKLEIVVAARPEDPAVHERIADAYRIAGNTEAAERHLQQAQTLEEALQVPAQTDGVGTND